MTNKCPFCKETISKHKTGRCLDHWIEAVKEGYKHVKAKHTSSESTTSYYRCIKAKNWLIYPAPKYSEDLNKVITLWQNGDCSTFGEFVLFNLLAIDDEYIRPPKLLWYVWDKQILINYCQSGFSNKFKPLAEANDPALAISRAYLITNLKEVEA